MCTYRGGTLLLEEERNEELLLMVTISSYWRGILIFLKPSKYMFALDLKNALYYIFFTKGPTISESFGGIVLNFVFL